MYRREVCAVVQGPVPDTTAILVAAGASRRMGFDKLSYRLPDGRTVLETSCAALAAHPAVRQVVLVAGANRPECERIAAACPKPCCVVDGGETRADSVRNGLAAAEGAPISAAADGVVRYAGVHSSYGNYVRILHADGDETLYAHMQYVFVRSGQPVSAGEMLGTVGETGNATGPHLHFEILHEGLRYDPSEVLQAAS